MEPKFVDVKGIRTRYFDEGEGEAVLFISGGQFGTKNCGTDWDRNVAALANLYRVITIDKLGQGFTDNPRGKYSYDLESVVEHLNDFLMQMGIDRAHIVGHSRGGYAAMRLAMRSPSVVASICIVDSGSLMHEFSNFYPKIQAEADKIADTRAKYAFMIAAGSYGSTMVTDFWLDDLVSFMESDKCKEARRIADEKRMEIRRELRAGQREIRDWLASGALASTPMLLVWAYNDLGAPIHECGVPAMDQFFPHVHDIHMVVMNESGHSPHRERPELFNRMYSEFLLGLS